MPRLNEDLLREKTVASRGLEGMGRGTMTAEDGTAAR